MHLLDTLLNVDQQAYIEFCNEKNRPWCPNGSISIFTYEQGEWALKQVPLTADEYRQKYDPKTVHFCFLRHGETKFNAQERMQGVCDAPLTVTGIAQAEESRDALRSIHFDQCISSDLGRALATAEILCKGRNILIREEKRLWEVNFGCLEGTKISEDKENIFRRFRTSDYTDVGGENMDMVMARIRPCLREVIDAAEDGDRIMLVSHGNVYMILLQKLFGISFDEVIAGSKKDGFNPIPNCGIFSFSWNTEKGFILDSLMVSAADFAKGKKILLK